MPVLRYLVFLFVWVVYTAPASAQLEFNPYLGLATGKESIQLTAPNDAVNTYHADRFMLGLDVLIGARKLAPLVGIQYHPSTYESGTAAGFRYDRITLPVGLAYRVLEADFDINIVFHAAVAPGLTWGDGEAAGMEIDQGFNWSARGGATLYLGTVTLGAQFVRHLPADGYRRLRAGTFMVTLGARF